MITEQHHFFTYSIHYGKEGWWISEHEETIPLYLQSIENIFFVTIIITIYSKIDDERIEYLVEKYLEYTGYQNSAICGKYLLPLIGNPNLKLNESTNLRYYQKQPMVRSVIIQ